MNFAAILLMLLGEAKALSPVVLAVLSGLGMILTKGLGWGISEIFQALTFIFSGAGAVLIKQSVSDLSAAAAALSAAAANKGDAPAARS